MATIQKFYLHLATTSVSGTLPGSGTQSSVVTTPTQSYSGAATNRTMNATVGSAQQAFAVNTTAVADSWQGTMYGRWVSPPLEAQTIGAGTWTYSGAASESNAASNMLVWSGVIYIWRPSTGARVSYLFDNPDSGTIEPGTSQTAISRTFTCSARTIEDGDVIVFEVWSENTQSMGSSYVNTIYFDGTTEASATDCASFLDAPAALTLYAGTTRTADAALTASSATLAATATFAPGTKTATSSLTASSATLAATASVANPTYTSTSSLTAASATLAATATFAPGTKTATVSLAATSATLAATATFAPGTKTATATLAASAATLAATATFTPVYTSASDLTTTSASLSATASFAPPTYTATAAIEATSAVIEATASFTPVYTAAVALEATSASLVATATFSGGSPTYASTILADPDLVAYWRLDESSGTTAEDSFGSADLTIAGSVTLGATGMVDDGVSSFTFSRTSDGRASHAATSYPLWDVSIEGWFQASDLSTLFQCLVYNGTGNNGFGLFLNFGAATGRLYVLYDGVAYDDTGYTLDTNPHHLVLTRTASGTVTKLYADGVLVYSDASVVGNTPSGGFTIGNKLATGGDGFNGTVDDVSVYDSALSLGTVQAHYAAGGGSIDLFILSAATGDWDETATWDGGVVPGDGDRAYIQDGHTVTVTDWRIVGRSPAGATGIDLRVGTTGTLVISGTGRLTLRGNGRHDTSSASGAGAIAVDLQDGAIFEFDATQADTPSTAAYVWDNGDAIWSYRRWQGRGSFIIRSVAGAAQGRFKGADDQGFPFDFRGEAGQFLLQRLGTDDVNGGVMMGLTAGDDRFMYIMEDGLAEDCRIIGCPGNIAHESVYRFLRMTFLDGQSPTDLHYRVSGYSGTADRRVEDCSFSGAFLADGQDGLNVVGNSFLGGAEQSGTGVGASATDNLVIRVGSQYIRPFAATTEREYRSCLRGDTNTKLVLIQASSTWDDCIFEDFNETSDGEVFTTNLAAVDSTHTINRSLIIPMHDGTGLRWAEYLSDQAFRVVFDHCTGAAGDAAIGFGHSGDTGVETDRAELHNSILVNFSDAAGSGDKAGWITTDYEDGLLPANAHHNCGWRLAASRYPSAEGIGYQVKQSNTSAAMGVDDVDVDPFPDLSTTQATRRGQLRRISSWARTVLGLSGTDAEVEDAAFEAIRVRHLPAHADHIAGATPEALYEWVYAGWATTNAALATAASDGSTIGAIAMEVGSHPVGILTQPRFGVPGRRYGSFAGKAGTVATYTAAATLTAAPATLAATASHTPPAVAATAELVASSASLSASTTHAPPAFAALADLSASSSALAATASHTVPIFAAAADLSASSASLSASVTHVVPTYTADAVLTASSAVLTAFTSPTFVSVAALEASPAALTASASHTPPTFAASAELVAAPSLLSAVATAAPPAFTGLVALVASSATLSASAVNAAAVFQATATLSAAPATLAASSTFAAPSRVATAALVASSAILAALVPEVGDTAGVFFFRTFILRRAG